MTFGILDIATFVILALGVTEVIFAVYIYRQSCDVAYLPMQSHDAIPIDVISMKICLEMPLDSCAICLDEYTPEMLQRLTVCGHVFCAKCFEMWYSNKPKCPLCNAEFRTLI